jgi:ornithine lipid ester-linked acyl 2-hydroxylase
MSIPIFSLKTDAKKDSPEPVKKMDFQLAGQESRQKFEAKVQWLQEFRTHRRRWLKKRGKRILRSLFSYLGTQSLVGDPPVFDAAQFPWAMELEKNYDAIKQELQAILEMREYIPLFHELSPDQQKISTGQNWRTFFLMGFGEEAELSWKQCPETMKVLSQIPNVRTAFFSILGPNYHIPAHRGVTKGLIRCHLALVVPDHRAQCVMRVGDQLCQWEQGRCLVFDDTNNHEVWNHSDQERIVLLVDVDRPMRLIGRIISRLLIFGIRRTGYVKDARKNLKMWEALFEQAASERMSSVKNNNSTFHRAGKPAPFAGKEACKASK